MSGDKQKMVNTFFFNNAFIEHGDQIGIPAVLMRGGSSKGLYFKRECIPEYIEMQDKMLLSIYGSPDARQIDGIGGSDPLTSKAIIVKKSERDNIDIEYLFAQIGIDNAKVSYGGNCGNMLSGVGPFSIDEGMVEVKDPVTTIRILNLNTNQIIVAKVPVSNGKAASAGSYHIAGVPKAGAEITLSFIDPQPTMGTLLPTGNAIDIIDLDRHQIHVSLIDSVTPFVFVDSKDLEYLGVKGEEDINAISSNSNLMCALEEIRSNAAKWMGLVKRVEDATTESPNIPRVVYVSKPSEKDKDITVRQMSMQRVHKAFSVTGSICTAVASTIEGTVVNKIISAPTSGEAGLKISHPSGVINLSAGFTDFGGERKRSVTISRNSRRIMSGYVFMQKKELQ